MPARGTQMTFWLAIGIAAIAWTAGAAVKPCSRHRCRAAIAASCEPLLAGALPTRETMISGGVETLVGLTQPIQDACLSCHDADDARAHAQLNTTDAGVEACGVCHGENGAFAVSAVHGMGTP